MKTIQLKWGEYFYCCKNLKIPGFVCFAFFFCFWKSVAVFLRVKPMVANGWVRCIKKINTNIHVNYLNSIKSCFLHSCLLLQVCFLGYWSLAPIFSGLSPGSAPSWPTASQGTSGFDPGWPSWFHIWDHKMHWTHFFFSSGLTHSLFGPAKPYSASGTTVKKQNYKRLG